MLIIIIIVYKINIIPRGRRNSNCSGLSVPTFAYFHNPVCVCVESWNAVELQRLAPRCTCARGRAALHAARAVTAHTAHPVTIAHTSTLHRHIPSTCPQPRPEGQSTAVKRSPAMDPRSQQQLDLQAHACHQRAWTDTATTSSPLTPCRRLLGIGNPSERGSNSVLTSTAT